jgi:Reverse gyrase
MYSGDLSAGTSIISVILVVFIKLLVVVFVISLLIGLFLTAKRYLFNEQDIAAFKSVFVPVATTKRTCSVCGKTLKEDWKVCPYCAEETIN